MSLNPRIVRALQFRIYTYIRVADRLLHARLVVGTAEGGMLFQLLQATCIIEPSPTDEVETTTELTSELLRALHVGNLLEELVGRAEVRKFQICKTSTAAHLVNPVDSLLCRTIHFVLALGSAQQYV